MHIDSLKSYGNGLVVNIQKTIDNICTYLKENRLVVGKGLRLEKTSNGNVLTLVPQEIRGGATVIQTSSAPAPSQDFEYFGQFTPIVKDNWLYIFNKISLASMIDFDSLSQQTIAGYVIPAPPLVTFSLSIAKIPIDTGSWSYIGMRILYDTTNSGWIPAGNCDPASFPEGSIIPNWLYTSGVEMRLHTNGTKDFIKPIAARVYDSQSKIYRVFPMRMPSPIYIQGVYQYV